MMIKKLFQAIIEPGVNEWTGLIGLGFAVITLMVIWAFVRRIKPDD